MREAFLTDAGQGFNGEFGSGEKKPCGFQTEITVSNPVMRLMCGK
jgi:hypothetical protein